MSFEPLSYDVAPLVDPRALSWAIIGAASRGSQYYAPDPKHLETLLHVLERGQVPVFMKGNLRGFATAWGIPIREEFPEPIAAEQGPRATIPLTDAYTYPLQEVQHEPES
jgi:hypothetical protein